MQITVDEVDLLKPAKALADVLRAGLPDALDRLELGVGGRQDRLEAAEVVDDLLGHQPRQPRDPAERAVAARRDREVKGVGLAVVAEQLGEATEVEQLGVVELARARRAPLELCSVSRAM